jgi:hypothetical protein
MGRVKINLALKILNKYKYLFGSRECEMFPYVSQSLSSML